MIHPRLGLEGKMLEWVAPRIRNGRFFSFGALLPVEARSDLNGMGSSSKGETLGVFGVT